MSVRDVQSTGIDDRERLELLHKHVDWSRCFHENLPVGVYETSADGVICYANKVMHELLGVPSESRELLGRSAADFYVRDRATILARASDHQWTSAQDLELIRDDGSTVWVRDFFRVVRDQDGDDIVYQGILTPVDDLIETREKLEIDEQQLSFIGETSSDLITLLTASEYPEYIYASCSHREILGYEAEELIGKSSRDLVHPEDLPLLLEMYQQHVLPRMGAKDERGASAAPTAEIRFRFLASNGQWHWIESVVTYVRGMLMLVSRDLTYDRELSRKLHNVDTYIRPMLNETMSSILTCSPRGHVVDFRFSSSLEALLGRAPLLKCIHLRDVARVLDLPALLDIPDAVSQDSDTVVEKELQARLDGESVWFHLRAQCIQGDGMSGDNPLIVILLSDISGARKSQLQLAESEKRFRELFDSVGSLIYVRDFDGTILAANRMFCNTFEIGEEDAVGMHISEIYDPEFVKSREELESLYSSESTVRSDQDVRAHSRSGRQVWLDNQFRIRLQNAEPVLEVIGHDVTERREQEAARLKGLEELERTLEGTVTALTSIVERRDSYTAGHQEHVAEIACAIGSAMGYSDDRLRGLRMAAMLHDIGKMSIPTDILVKPTRLNAAEMDLVRQHAIIGYEILKGIDFPWPIAAIVRQHHERLDGSGYPDAISGGDILEEARILAVADVVEAMSAHRPYRPALGPELAVEEVRRGAGTRYDALVVNTFRILLERQAIGLSGGVLTRLNPGEIERG